jgi:hypothetical protein
MMSPRQSLFQENYHADWMREAACLPDQAVESNLPNWGLCDMDLKYDWHEGAPSAEVIQEASRWLAGQVKESPNDDVQILPEVDYASLKAEQRDVFLQVMAYFKKLKGNDGFLKPPPFHINSSSQSRQFNSDSGWQFNGNSRSDSTT